ncbi:MAG: hypothetical protein V1754_12170, partial [Pseudomonadota bacterium]
MLYHRCRTFLHGGLALFLIAAGVTTFGWQTPVEAQKSVVVLEFPGPGGTAARARFISAMRDNVKTIGTKTYRRVALNLGADTRSETGIAAVCSRIKCHAVVMGEVTADRGEYTIVVAVHDGTGVLIGRRAATVKNKNMVGPAGEALGQACARLIGNARYNEFHESAPPPEEKSPPEEDPISPLFDTGQEKASRKTQQQNQNIRDAMLSRNNKRKSISGLFAVSLAMGGATRNCTQRGANSAQDSYYDGGFYPEFTLAGEVYPLAPWIDNFTRNIGVGISYSRHLSIETKMPGQYPGQEVAVETRSQELLADLRLRWPFWNKPT